MSSLLSSPLVSGLVSLLFCFTLQQNLSTMIVVYLTKWEGEEKRSQIAKFRVFCEKRQNFLDNTLMPVRSNLLSVATTAPSPQPPQTFQFVPVFSHPPQSLQTSNCGRHPFVDKLLFLISFSLSMKFFSLIRLGLFCEFELFPISLF